MDNGYYEDLNRRLYRVTDDSICEKVDDKFVPVLYPQNFAMYLEMGLLTKKDIVELELEQLTIPLYLNGDAMTPYQEEFYSLQEKLPMTPDEEVQMLTLEGQKIDKEIDSLESQIEVRKEMLIHIFTKIEALGG